MSTNTETMTLTVTLPTRCIEQFAQFCKRTSFDDAFDKTEPHVSRGERTSRAYMMIDGILAVEKALEQTGYMPR